MKRRFGFRDLHFRRCESQPLRALLEPAREERLSAPVLSTYGFELGSASANALELLAYHRLERLKTDGERLETSLRHCAASKRVDHFVPTLRANHRRSRLETDCSSNCAISSSRFSSMVSDG